jgi:serine/threonine protein kinase
MVTDGNGVCPHCEAYTGPVGTPCIRPECVKKNYLCIPIRWYDAAKAYSARKNKPIDPLVGRMIERYLLAANIGEGGMGSVYVAIQKPLFREVALKLISDLDLNRHSVGRFEREARAISLLDHPNIVKIHDYGVGDLDKKVPYMALEFLRHGRTLRKAFAAAAGTGKVEGALVLTIFRQVLNALGAAHAVGIVHRDVKPENVMVVPVHGDPNLVKVLDFGLARLDSDDSTFEGDAIASGRLAGTPYYMAPEQIPRKGASGDIDGRADLYAVTVMLFEILTGVRPFDGDSPLAVLARKLDPSFDPMNQPEAKALSKGIRTFLAKGLSRVPADRFASASQMLEALESVLETRASAVGLVVLEAPSSSDRIEVPSDQASASTPLAPLLPPDEPDPPAPAGGAASQVPQSPFFKESRFKKHSGGLELDMPEVIGAAVPASSTAMAAAGTAHPKGPATAGGSEQPSGSATPAGLPTGKSGPHTPVRTPTARISTPKGLSDAAMRTIAWALAGVVVLAILLSLAPWVIVQTRVAAAEEAMSALRIRLVQGGRFIGFESGALRPTGGADYLVLGATGTSEAGGPLNDPWGNPYRVRYLLDKRSYLLRSDGPDGEEGPCRGDEPQADDLCVLLAGR